MPWTHQGKIIREGRGWVDANGVKHPTNWASWSDEEKTSKGLVWQEPPAPYDNRFWWDAETPKALDTLKPEWVAQVKAQAGSLLAQTDWYVTREAETGKRMPPKVLAYREAVRATADGVAADLEAAVDHAEFVAIATSFAWPDPEANLTPNATLVNAERDRRLHGDFLFNGVAFQRDPTSLQRITGAATLAGFALGAGAQPGDLRWANPDRDFVWIASDNSIVPMDAQTAFAFGQVAASVETDLIFKAKALRAMDPIPLDYTDDKWWS